MKTLLFILTISIFLIVTTSITFAQSESITLTTYYPAPFGAYDRVKLVPHNSSGTGSIACTTSGSNPTEGTMYYDDGTAGPLTRGFYYCDTTGNWQKASGYWTSSGTNIYNSNSGNVGIGTNSPQRSLQVGDDASGIALAPSSGSPNAGYIRFGDNTGWKLNIARSRESSGGALNAGTTGALVTVQDNGKVGIGTTTPGARLEISYDSDPYAQTSFNEHIRGTGHVYGMSIGEYWKVSNARSGTTFLSDASMNFGLDKNNDNTGTRFAWFNNAMPATDFSATTPLMELTEDGNLFIGTTGTTANAQLNGFDICNADPSNPICAPLHHTHPADDIQSGNFAGTYTVTGPNLNGNVDAYTVNGARFWIDFSVAPTNPRLCVMTNSTCGTGSATCTSTATSAIIDEGTLAECTANCSNDCVDYFPKGSCTLNCSGDVYSDCSGGTQSSGTYTCNHVKSWFCAGKKCDCTFEYTGAAQTYSVENKTGGGAYCTATSPTPAFTSCTGSCAPPASYP